MRPSTTLGYGSLSSVEVRRDLLHALARVAVVEDLRVLVDVVREEDLLGLELQRVDEPVEDAAEARPAVAVERGLRSRPSRPRPRGSRARPGRRPRARRRSSTAASTRRSRRAAGSPPGRTGSRSQGCRARGTRGRRRRCGRCPWPRRCRSRACRRRRSSASPPRCRAARGSSSRTETTVSCETPSTLVAVDVERVGELVVRPVLLELAHVGRDDRRVHDAQLRGRGGVLAQLAGLGIRHRGEVLLARGRRPRTPRASCRRCAGSTPLRARSGSAAPGTC